MSAAVSFRRMSRPAAFDYFLISCFPTLYSSSKLQENMTLKKGTNGGVTNTIHPLAKGRACASCSEFFRVQLLRGFLSLNALLGS